MKISYPSYVSLDEFIDTAELKALDQYLVDKIENHISKKDEEYFLNAYRLNNNANYQPGAREIWLSRPTNEAKAIDLASYDKLEVPEMWHLTSNAGEFKLLMDFIRKLPFKSTSRILIIYDDAETFVPAHKDHTDTSICHEFVWFRTNFKKPFYMLNPQTEQKKYVESYAAWFDTVNQFHGTDSAKGLSFSIRVDGKFTEAFKQHIPTCNENPAAIPALWASSICSS